MPNSVTRSRRAAGTVAPLVLTAPEEAASVFVASPEGFRGENAGREPAMLVKELIQNAFDESPTRLDVTVVPDGEGVRLVVEDDVRGGIRDLSLVFTLWRSDKQDSPRKRGRMGRGLKEVISVSDRATITTERGSLEFLRTSDGKSEPRWARRTPAERRKRGTRVDIRVSLWAPTVIPGIEAFLRRMRPPEGTAFVVNGTLVARTEPTEIHEMTLPTVVYENGRRGHRALERRGTATVELIPALEPWIYEMGIPVEAIAFPMSIDIGQRVPLRDRRDTVPDSFRRELFAQLLVRRAETMDRQAFHDEWVHVGSQRADLLDEGTKERIADAYTQGAAYAASPDTVRTATGWHIETVSLRGLPEAVRDIVREVGTNAKDLIEQRLEETLAQPPRAPRTADERRTIAVFEAIAAGIDRRCTVALFDGMPNHGGASFDQTLRRLNLFPARLGPAFFAAPFGAIALRILIHELAHWRPIEQAHGFDYKMDVEEIGAQVAAFLFRERDRLLALSVEVAS